MEIWILHQGVEPGASDRAKKETIALTGLNYKITLRVR